MINLKTEISFSIKPLISLEHINNHYALQCLREASADHNLRRLQSVARVNPDEFKFVLTNPDQNGKTPLYWAAWHNDLNMVKWIAETAPEEFKVALTIQRNETRETPLHWAAEHHHVEMVKYMKQAAPKEFKEVLKIQNVVGYTPILTAAVPILPCLDLELFKLLAGDDLQVANIVSDVGGDILHILKMERSRNYREITQLFKSCFELRVFDKELFNRKALAQAWDLGGKTLIKAGDVIGSQSMKLEGAYPAGWYHFMAKHLARIKTLYLRLFNDTQIKLFASTLDGIANTHCFSLEDKVKRIQAGLPVILCVGFISHAVNILIWGDQFVLCNRGRETGRAFEMYHFNSKNLDVQVLKNIQEIRRRGSQADYEKLFSTILPKQLNFSRNALDLRMEQALQLPGQTVGNCSFVNSMAAVYAFMLLANVRGINSEGHLLKEEALPILANIQDQQNLSILNQISC